jgi:hypothetical protein
LRLEELGTPRSVVFRGQPVSSEYALVQNAQDLLGLPEWELACRVANSTLFLRSERLRNFLLYVSMQQLRGNAREITEQRIGIEYLIGLPTTVPGKTISYGTMPASCASGSWNTSIRKASTAHYGSRFLAADMFRFSFRPRWMLYPFRFNLRSKVQFHCRPAPQRSTFSINQTGACSSPGSQSQSCSSDG